MTRGPSGLTAAAVRRSGHSSAVRLALASVCLLVLIGAGCGGGSDAPDLQARTLVLARPDVPDGFVVNATQSGPVSNEEVARGRAEGYVGRLEEWGRVEGHSTQFARDDVVLGPLAGAETIDSVASVYEDADGAAESFASGVREYPRSGFVAAGMIELGDEGRAFRTTATLAGRKVEYIVLTWRRGRVIANVVSAGRPGRIKLPALQALGERQDRRIARASA